MTILKIEYLNAKKKFQKDEEIFKGKTWKEANDKAMAWGRENLGGFNSDMIETVEE